MDVDDFVLAFIERYTANILDECPTVQNDVPLAAVLELNRTVRALRQRSATHQKHLNLLFKDTRLTQLSKVQIEKYSKYLISLVRNYDGHLPMTFKVNLHDFYRQLCGIRGSRSSSMTSSQSSDRPISGIKSFERLLRVQSLTAKTLLGILAKSETTSNLLAESVRERLVTGIVDIFTGFLNREHVEQFFIDNGIDASFPSSSEDEASVDGDRPMATKRLSDGIAAVEMQALTVSPTDKKNSEFETTHMVQSQSSDSHSSPFIIDGDRSNSSTPVTVDTPPYVNDVISIASDEFSNISNIEVNSADFFDCSRANVSLAEEADMSIQLHEANVLRDLSFQTYSPNRTLNKTNDSNMTLRTLDSAVTVIPRTRTAETAFSGNAAIDLSIQSSSSRLPYPEPLSAIKFEAGLAEAVDNSINQVACEMLQSNQTTPIDTLSLKSEQSTSSKKLKRKVKESKSDVDLVRPRKLSSKGPSRCLSECDSDPYGSTHDNWNLFAVGALAILGLGFVMIAKPQANVM